MRRFGWLLLIWASVAIQAASASAQSPPRVVVGEINGVINPISAQYVDRILAQAVREDAAAVVFKINTPGGLVSSTLQITTAFLNAEVPVITYVSPSGAMAASAGTFITMAGHVAAMAPATNIGAAHPVGAGGGDIEGDVRDKIVNTLVTEAQKIALARGRNAEWAEDAVRRSVSARDDEAVALNVVDFMARDLADLLRQSHGRTVEVAGVDRTLDLEGAVTEERGKTFVETILHILVDPQIAVLLFTLGMYGLIFELSNPGAIFPGVVGVISILLALFALGTLDANAAGVAFLVFAIILFVAEIMVVSHGLLTAGGIAALIFGMLLLFPPGEPTLPGFRLAIEPGVIAGISAVSAGFTFLVFRTMLRSRRLPVVTGMEALRGAVGIAETELAPTGVVRLGGEDWSAAVEDGRVEQGERVRVRRVESVTLIVEPDRRDGGSGTHA